MKGIILAGGLGTRLGKLTTVTNKHLLPVFDKPMVFYPIETLVKAGMKEIMLIVSGQFAGNFISLLKNGQDFGLDNIEYAYQEKPDGGIADALKLAKNYADGEDVCVILGDNTTDADIKKQVNKFHRDGWGVHLFLKQVNDPCRYGVAKFNENKKIEKIIEKPAVSPSNCAVTGVYIYDYRVFDFIEECTPSERNQLEITDVNNMYCEIGDVNYSFLDGFWADAGTPESLFLASKYYYELNNKK